MIKTVRRAMFRLGGSSQLYGMDAAADSIGRYFVDHFWHCPPLSVMRPENFVDYCLRHNISIVFPSRDGELIYFSENRELFAQQGIYVMIPEPSAVKSCLDKLQFYHLLHDRFPVVPTSEVAEDWDGLFVVKQRFGAGSAEIGIGLDRSAAILHSNRISNPIFQPYIVGSEYSIDVYIDQNGKSIGAIVRQRNKVIQGESQVTTSCRYPVLEKLSINMAEVLQLRGHAIFQILVDQQDKPHILECNCRFGGASTLSVEMGLDTFYWFIKESHGESISFVRPDTERMLIRYPEDLIL